MLSVLAVLLLLAVSAHAQCIATPSIVAATIGVPITPITTRGCPNPVLACTIQPALPAGLVLALDCSISGTPSSAVFVNAHVTYELRPSGAGTPFTLFMSVSGGN